MLEKDKVFHKHRLLLYYKGDISALVLFAQQENGSVCFPGGLPALSSILDVQQKNGKVNIHPAMVLNQLNQLLHFEPDMLKIEVGFSEQVDVPGDTITIHMARFMPLDPPHRQLQVQACRLRTLPELRGRPPAELELLRRAYVQLMEG